MDVHGLFVDHRSPAWDRTNHWPTQFRLGHRDRTMRSNKPILTAVSAPKRRIPCVAQLGRSLRNNIEHRLHVRRRAGDNAEDFAGRSLLLQRLLELVEQPDIFYGDDGLVGEGFEELDLRWCEGTYLNPPRRQRYNDFALLTKRNG